MDPLRRTLLSGYVGQGPRVEEFERALEPWVGRPFVLTVNSGTSALQLAMRLAGVAPGRSVVTTPASCFATNAPIITAGARVVWADVDPLSGNIDPADVARKIRRDTAAIVCVHWGGMPCNMMELNAVAAQYGLPVIQDAAHAFGAEYRGQPVGCASAYCCYSTQAIKHVTTIEGGILVCRDEEEYQRGKLLRWYGIDREGPRVDMRCEQDIYEAGYKINPTDVQATIGLEQLKYAADILATHRANAAFYDAMFSHLPGLTLTQRKPDRRSSFWLYTILAHDRPDFLRHMQEARIEASRVHARNDLHTVTRPYRVELPGVDAFDAQQVSIPVGWWIGPREREYIAEAVIAACS